MTYPITIFEVTSGGSSAYEQKRYFTPSQYTDAAQLFAEQLLKLDADVTCGGAYVMVKRLPDSVYPEGQTLLAWTKVSNERPMAPGTLTPGEILDAL